MSEIEETIDEKLHRGFECLRTIPSSLEKFATYYVKWQLSDLNNSKQQKIIRSFDIDVPVYFLPTSTTWTLQCEFDPQQQGVRRSLEYSLVLSQTQRPIPIVYRMTVNSIENGDEKLSKYGVNVFECNDQIGGEMVVEADETVTNTILQCWISIPLCYKVTSEIFLAVHSLVEVCSGAANRVIFKRAISKDGDVGDEDETLSDVTLVIVSKDRELQRRFNCHGCILSSASPVFRQMLLKRQWSECLSTDKGKRIIEMPNTDENAIECMLAYIYLRSLPKHTDPFKGDSLVNLIDLAEKYDLQPLKKRCEAICIWLSNDWDPIEQLKIADLYNMPKLRIVSMLQLCTGLAYASEKRKDGSISEDLFLEIISTYEKRRAAMKIVDLEN